MKKILIAGSLCLSAMLYAKPVADTDIGLRRTPLETENKTKLQSFKYGDKAPGESKVFDRAYENAPPMISHDIEGMTDFTQSTNTCLDCHAPDVAKDVGARPVPKSHQFDLRSDKVVANGGVSDSRWNCTQCHAPQADVKPLVGNTFKPIYRNKTSKNSSNLLEVINEGVE